MIGARAFVDRWLRVKPRSKAINAPIVETRGEPAEALIEPVAS